MHSQWHQRLVSRALEGALKEKGPKLGLLQEPAPFAEYLRDPVGWCQDIGGWDPWEAMPGQPYGQADILRAMVSHRKVAVLGCNGLGKSFQLGGGVLPWFMTTRRDARARHTAGSFPQVKATHRKVRQAEAQSLHRWPGKILRTPEWEVAPEWLCDGVSPDDAATMQGLHATGPDVVHGDGGLLAVIDEAGAAQRFKFEAMNSYMTRSNSYFLIQGNANRNEWWEEFWEKAEADPTWATFRISADMVPPHVIKPGWIEEQAAYWGEDSAQFKIRVLAQFAGDSDQFAVFSIADFEEAQEVWKPNGWGLSMGVDVARGNEDFNAVVISKDGKVIFAKAWHSHDLTKVADRVEDIAQAHGIPAGEIHVDVTGIGAGVVDILNRKGWMVEAVSGSGATKGDHAEVVGYKQQVKNRRAELYWAARQLLRKGVVCVPEEWKADIWKEAVNVLYLDKDVIQIEPKEKIRKRLKGKSPDFTDAWVYSLSRSGSADYLWVG